MSRLKEINTPVFYAEGVPDIDYSSYTLTVEGVNGGGREFTFEQIKDMPVRTVDARLTSVSGFSVRALWQGVSFSEFLKRFEIPANFKYVYMRSIGGYDTTVPLERLDDDRILLCYMVNGELLEPEHGAPLRFFIPYLWGYKSIKAVNYIRFQEESEKGYWEQRGYSNEAEIEPGTTLDVNSGERREIKGGEVDF